MQRQLPNLTRGRRESEIGNICVCVCVCVITESIVGVEASGEAADGVEHVEAERAAELRGQPQQEAGHPAEVRPDGRRGRRRGAHHQPPPEHRRQRRELLRRRRAPHLPRCHRRPSPQRESGWRWCLAAAAMAIAEQKRICCCCCCGFRFYLVLFFFFSRRFRGRKRKKRGKSNFLFSKYLTPLIFFNMLIIHFI